METEVPVRGSAPVIEQTVLGRRSIRAFRDEPIARELVEEILRETVWAPSPHNSQPCRFTVLFRQEEKEGIACAMACRLRAELEADGLDADMVERQTRRSRQRISEAPVVILCSIVADGLVAYPDVRRSALEREMAVQCVGAALQTLFLAAHARGVGTCWMAAPMYCPDVVRDTLALPEAYDPQALVLMGYAAVPGKIRERRPFEEVVELR